MNGAFGKVAAGQILLIVCCVFYLIWWNLCYRPGAAVNRISGINGILLLVTAACGIFGAALSVFGAGALPRMAEPKFTGNALILGGIIAYILLLLITNRGMGRPVTTELVLITGWTVLELEVISSANAAGRISGVRFWIAFAVIAAAFLISMILYVLYYRMDPMPAFYAAMVPLITEAVSMGVLLIIMTVR